MVTRATVWSLFSITEGGGGEFPVLFSLEMGRGGGGGGRGNGKKK